MNPENVQDAKAVEAPPRDKMAEAVANVTGVTGVALLLGPDITTGLAGLPEGAPPYVMAAGACLVVRSIMQHALLREGR